MIILSILLSVAAANAIGFWWYSYAGFGKSWVKMMGLDPKKMKEHNKDMNKTYSLMLVVSVIEATILNVVINRFDHTPYTMMANNELVGALSVAFLMWLGFVFTTQLIGHLFSGRKFQPALLTIDTSYQLISLLIMATILTLL